MSTISTSISAYTKKLYFKLLKIHASVYIIHRLSLHNFIFIDFFAFLSLHNLFFRSSKTDFFPYAEFALERCQMRQ